MMNRREALLRLGGLVAGGLFSGAGLARASNGTSATLAAAQPAAGEAFTFAHITDVHIFPELNAEKWFAKCLHQIQQHSLKPSMILNTGDCLMDSLKVDRDRANALWAMWNGITKNENSLPMRHCLGNHDAWALGLGEGAAETKDPHYGKKLALDKLGMDKLYYSFDHGAWHFIMLDTVQPAVGKHPTGWTANLDDEQFEWLKADLAAVPADRHVAVYSHVPILQMASMLYLKPDDEGRYIFGAQHMLMDARRIVDLFGKHPQVKLCLSGHIHLLDSVKLNNVTYICDGAVCGKWWRGARIDAQPGYSLTTFKPDGTFEYKYSEYGWKPTDQDQA